ncbi:putative fatty acyl-CoA reductase CG5065 [Agrilus planipennis]|uniref:Fatty acyl-CoA reductase n=1 Tax=Agrilus planipennis TaxID=224129 RepID=A0A7F5REM5_AGRPL|nr:putative fatty acyl-CoA reductase CG5065 [Agrilus planipennis]
MSTPMQQWYTGRSVFVTGGTGFMGKILLEKLVRAVVGIKNVYVLIRPKKGLTPEERLELITKLPIFDKIRETDPKAVKKLIAVDGDVTQAGLGLSDKNKKLIKKSVSIVIHGAAYLRLEACVKDAIIQNTLGTKNLIDFCKEIPNLKSLVHLSTAFCHADVEYLEEKIYPPTKDPYEVMRLIEWLDDKSLEQIEPSLLYPHPNSYTFSKRLAETIVYDAGHDLPATILRPSIVIPALHEPIPGWVDSLNGPVGILVGAGKGVIRTMLVNVNNHAEFIPVDIAINGILVGAWYRGTRDFQDTPVYNVTQSQDLLSITWGEALDRMKGGFYKNPFEWTLWYPGGYLGTNVFIHKLCIIFMHKIPAYVIDSLLFILRQKTFMVRLQRRISTGLEVLQYFALREWHFSNKNCLVIADEMVEEDLNTFYMANAEYDVDIYMLTALLGTRKYCIKESLKSIPRSRRNLMILYILDRLIKIVFLGYVIWFILDIFHLMPHISTFWSENKVSLISLAPH